MVSGRFKNWVVGLMTFIESGHLGWQTGGFGRMIKLPRAPRICPIQLFFRPTSQEEVRRKCQFLKGTKVGLFGGISAVKKDHTTEINWTRAI